MRNGLHWNFQAGRFTIFGQEGWVNERSKWVVPMDIVVGVMHPVAPAPISGSLLGIIQGDIRDGNGDKIAYVGVGPFQGLLLALEGVITERRLVDAKETVDRIILSVKLGGVARQLVILEKPLYEMATYDVHDEVV